MRFRIILGVIGAAIISALYWYFTEAINKRTKAVMENIEAEEGPTPAPPASTRLAKIRTDMYKSPAQCVQQLDAIIQAPENEAEKTQAVALLPQLLELSLHPAARDGRLDEARAILARLKRDFPQDQATRNANLAWGRTLASETLKALSKGDPQTIEALYKEYVDGGYYLPPSNDDSYNGDSPVLQKYTSYRAKLWRELPPTQAWADAGQNDLEATLGALLEHNDSYRLFSDLLTGRPRDTTDATPSDPPGEMFLNAGNKFISAKKWVPALNTFALAHMLLNQGRPWRAGDTKRMDEKARQQMNAAIESRLVALAIYAAKQGHDSPGSIRSSLQPKAILETVANWVQNPAERVKAYEAQLNLAVADYLKMTEPMLQFDPLTLLEEKMPYEDRLRINEQMNRARRDSYRISDEISRRISNVRLDLPNEDIRKSLAPALLAEIEREIPRNTQAKDLENARRSVLRKLISERRDLQLVQLPPEFVERRMRMLVIDGAQGLQGAREDAFRKLREVIRSSEKPELISTVQTLIQTALKQSRAKENFEALIELAGFYSAEFGAGLAQDPFRGEFLQMLQTAAAKFKTSEPMKYVFVEALIAGGFAGEPVGVAAQAETIRVAFEIVSNVSWEKDVPELFPSGISGWSSESVDNSTEYHILVVYDGAEKFSLLCNPLRKGSFALKNGPYRIAVMTPIGSIRPYRTERKIADQHVLSQYYVMTSGEKKPSHSLATGDYTLLRRTPELEPFSVNPQTGMLVK